jgi:hypothetical protein
MVPTPFDAAEHSRITIHVCMAQYVDGTYMHLKLAFFLIPTVRTMAPKHILPPNVNVVSDSDTEPDIDADDMNAAVQDNSSNTNVIWSGETGTVCRGAGTSGSSKGENN